MKAAHNGVPQLSTPDGWWVEGYKKGKTGWTIREKLVEETGKTTNNLYDLLNKEIVFTYYNNPKKWQSIMRSVISLNASYFNTNRTLKQYIKEAYKL
jgi:starch phosphorylase